MSWTRICCGIDFSGPSRAAMYEAARLARQGGGFLTLVHVFPSPVTAAAAGVVAFSPDELEARMRRELGAKLDAAKADAEGVVPGTRVETFLGCGRPADEIARFAGVRGFDLVVVGTHGHGGIRRRVLGSVAEQVVRAAPCPVLVFRTPERVLER
jgi:nucleotide-binding universal stress UspA family protein